MAEKQLTRKSINKSRSIYRKLPAGIWALGLVSMLMDTSSELIHSLLPIYLSTVLGASMVTIGVIEGIAEGTVAVMKLFSGVFSDYFAKRKLFAVIGYGLAALTKPIFPLASTIGWVFGARFLDRIGKGIRGAPRDALVADIAPKQLLGAAYGLRQSLDSVGAFFGPLLAIVFMVWLANDIRRVLWVAVIPAFLAVILLVVGVREPAARDQGKSSGNRLSLADVKRMPSQYWLVVSLGAVFSLARFSEAFLILRAKDVGLAITHVPVTMIVMNIVYSLFAYPAGVAADRFPARNLLIVGLGFLVISDVFLAMAASPAVAFIGTAFWGLHMAFTQGLLAKLVADSAVEGLRGTAFGVFNLISGGAIILASVTAGLLWQLIGASATFYTGAGFAAMAAIGLLFYHPKRRL